MKQTYPIAALTLLLSACSLHTPQQHEAASTFGAVATPRAEATVAPADFGELSWREVGPAVMGGRLDSVVSVPGDENTIYLGHSSGGLYKSTNAGMSFAPVFHAGSSSSIGAIAIAPSEAKTVYAGTGEGFPRNTAAIGDGVFVSHDAGGTWHAAGLKEHSTSRALRSIHTILKTVLVAAMGPEFSAGGDRGIYRTTDGGAHWTRALYVNPTTGGSDVAFDPSNPLVAYAGTFDYLREP